MRQRVLKCEGKDINSWQHSLFLHQFVTVTFILFDLMLPV